MKKTKQLLVFILCVLMLCSCSAQDQVNENNNNDSIIVNLATPTSSTPSAGGFSSSQTLTDMPNRYHIQGELKESESGGLSFSGKLFLQYTNSSQAPLYSLSLSPCTNLTIHAISVNGISSNYNTETQSDAVTLPLPIEIGKGESAFFYMSYSISELSDLNDAMLRQNDMLDLDFEHSISITVPDNYSVTSSLGTPSITSSTRRTFTFTAKAKNDFDITLSR
ncbi:MAG: hypothetical protein IJO48_04050 [Clostridia bacterium]|nr:hypothetical protein [Clostridia bacterium]